MGLVIFYFLISDVSISITHDDEHKESITSQREQDITMLPSYSPKASFKRKKSSNARPPSYLTTRLRLQDNLHVYCNNNLKLSLK